MLQEIFYRQQMESTKGDACGVHYVQKKYWLAMECLIANVMKSLLFSAAKLFKFLKTDRSVAEIMDSPRVFMFVPKFNLSCIQMDGKCI